MRTHPSITVLVVVICSLAFACDDLKPFDDNPLEPTPPTLVTLELSGPTTFAPGQTVAYTLTAVGTNGTRENVTATAQWAANNANIVTTQGQGRYGGNGVGEAQITARHGALNASKEVVVVPTGTFRVTGRVVEFDGIFPVAGARVEARNSSGTGPTTESDGSGFFKLFGVTADAEIVVTRPGYDESRRQVTLDNHSTVNFELILSGPRPELAGTYSVTLDLTACRDGFRVEYARRVYTAVLRQSGTSIEVRFTEPAFAINSINRGNLMQGRLQGGSLFLEALTSYYYYYFGPTNYPFMVETLPDDSRLVVSGSATLVESGGSYTGQMNGWAGNYGPRFPNDKYLGGCSTSQLTFTRR